MAAARAARSFGEAEGLGEFGGPLGRRTAGAGIACLDLNQLTKLAKAIGKARARAGSRWTRWRRSGWRC